MQPGRPYPLPQPAPQRPGQPRARPRVRWVATVPPGAGQRRRVAPERYTGPPSYPVMPRWGFPHVVWRWPTAVPGTPSDGPVPLLRLRMIARNTVTLLWTLAALTAVAAGGEVWRYVLLLRSRDTALSPGVVGASDAVVLAFSLLAFVLALFAGAAAVWWLFVARAAAAEEAGQEPPRPGWQVAVGTLVPVANLVLAGPIVAELEHAVLRRPAGERPRPSRLVLAWWSAWVANGVLLALTVAWRTRAGVQADADGVVLSALTDLAATALAALTAVVVQRFTRLLAPIDHELRRPPRVVRVDGAPAPARRPRPAHSAR
ncbi:uncharacterized protein DUF4328 [Prauserella shujinwangii]|uniref:Uncharacterized protein DUF4328 n=1 Tax=Prauserella shujinwangii TaxID=1453103 RepID=A0A2T0LVI4_9PSEU|nr:DUF4328 domain-containing protein [Prauserella shujinwangii]PRX47860.1 uncharacterized protein DUF4328 [Prauserella shujinwangii]